MTNGDEIPTDTLAESDNYQVWISQEPDGELVYHIEFGSVTAHFFREEWDEFLRLMDEARKATRDARS